MQINEFINRYPTYADWDPIDLTVALWGRDYADGQMGEEYKDIMFFAEKFGVDLDHTDLALWQKVGKGWDPGQIWSEAGERWSAGAGLRSAEDKLAEHLAVKEKPSLEAEAVDALSQYEQQAGTGLFAADPEQQRKLFEEMATGRGTTVQAEEQARAQDPFWRGAIAEELESADHPYNIRTGELQKDLSQTELDVADLHINNLKMRLVGLGTQKIFLH